MILSIEEVRARLKGESAALVITPLLLSTQLQVGRASVDIRLGEEFVIGDRSAMASIEPMHFNRVLAQTYLRRIRVPAGQSFCLHPRQFALAASLEYIRLPGDIVGHVLGRSRWARVGLVIAMASFIHPGYAGCLTLELQNLGDVPIELTPGLAVAQVVLEECVSVDQIDKDHLRCAIGPQPVELLSDEERMLIEALSPRPREDESQENSE